MENIIKIATQVRTPLALAGLIVALTVYLTIKLAPKLFPKLTKPQAARAFQLVMGGLFLLCLLAILIEPSASSSPPASSVSLGGHHPPQEAKISAVTNSGILIGNVEADHSTQSLVIVQNFGVPMERYDALVRSGAVSEVALDTFFQQIGETNKMQGNLSEKLERTVQHYTNLAEKLRKSEQDSAKKVADLEEGIRALMAGNLQKAAQLVKTEPPPPPMNLRIVAGQ